MVLIPPDIGLRLRLENELLPQPVTPVREIPASVPDLKPGQVFNARIQEVLPGNTYLALVAGKSLTLSLPEAVKSGDVLDLVVIDRTPRTVIAQIARPNQGALAADTAVYPHATFSRAARMISTLLAAEGQAPPAAALNRGLPLLAQPPTNGAALVPALNKAVVESGLFYESHQAQWVAGKLSLANLLQEPQGQHSSLQAQLPAYAGGGAASEALPDREAGGAPLLPGMSFESREESAETRSSQAEQAGLTRTVASMPEELRPLVQQQLDAAGTQRLLWHGEVWPGQSMEWQVEWEGARNGDADQQDAAEAWSTTLLLSTPRLGELQAQLRLGAGGIRIAMTAAEETSADDLRNGAPKLEQALAAAGVPLLGLTVKHAPEE